jgi:hypothetical protein
MKIWLVVLTILKNISQLGYVGIILPNIWGKNVPNHQPGKIIGIPTAHGDNSAGSEAPQQGRFRDRCTCGLC